MISMCILLAILQVKWIQIYSLSTSVFGSCDDKGAVVAGEVLSLEESIINSAFLCF